MIEENIILLKYYLRYAKQLRDDAVEIEIPTKVFIEIAEEFLTNTTDHSTHESTQEILNESL